MPVDPVSKPRRGIATIADLRARSVVDPLTHCWHWQGAMSGGGKGSEAVPKIHTFDHARGEKRTMSGPMAVWNIAHQAAPNAPLVYRACSCQDCVNPVHHRLARDRGEIGLHVRRTGKRKGTHVASRAASAALGRAALGIVDTPAEVIEAIRNAPAEITGRALAELHRISPSTVSKIRLGKRRVPRQQECAGVAA